MTVVDLILMSKGITEKGSYKDVAVYRSTYDKTQLNPVETISVSLNEGYSNLISDQNIELLEMTLWLLGQSLAISQKNLYRFQV